jgi:hypothetical protein
MRNATAVICLVGSLSISACGTQSAIYLDSSGNILPTGKITCVEAPVGEVVSDDIYVSKFGKPVLLRCPPKMIAKIIPSDGGPTDPQPEPKPSTQPSNDSEAFGSIASTEAGYAANYSEDGTVDTYAGGGVAYASGVGSTKNIHKEVQDQIAAIRSGIVEP